MLSLTEAFLALTCLHSWSSASLWDTQPPRWEAVAGDHSIIGCTVPPPGHDTLCSGSLLVYQLPEQFLESKQLEKDNLKPIAAGPVMLFALYQFGLSGTALENFLLKWLYISKAQVAKVGQNSFGLRSRPEGCRMCTTWGRNHLFSNRLPVIGEESGWAVKY